MADVGSTPTPGSNTEHPSLASLVEFAFHLRKEGYRDSTIERAVKVLKSLARRCNLDYPEEVKALLARVEWELGTKELACSVLANYYRYRKIPFSKPRYYRVDKVPFIPSESEADQLIGGCTKKVGSFLQFLKETGSRCGEAWAVKWTDLDLERGTVRITPEKGSNARLLRVSPRLCSLIGSLPKDGEKVWAQGKLENFRWKFEKQRKEVSGKLGNPRILGIHWHTLRHLKGTLEYSKTRDVVHVMRLLGHKSIANTLKYVQLLATDNGEYVAKMAKSLEEASLLVEAGFEYVTEMDGVKLFRKRK